MQQDRGHFRILDVPVRIRASFFIVAGLLGFVPGKLHLTLIWIAVVFVCILVHEAGHAFVARAFSHRPRIEIHALGGTTFHEGKKLSTTREVLVLLAGPFAGFALGGLAWLARPLLPDHEIARVVVRDVLWATIGYGVLNLVPIMPLDGGQVVRRLLDHFFAERGRKLMYGVEVVVGLTLVAATLAGGAPRATFLVVWLLIMRYREVAEFVRAQRDQRYASELARFDAAAKADDRATIIAVGPPLLSKVRSAARRANVAHALAHSLAQEGRFREAAVALEKMPVDWQADLLLKATILVETGKYDEAIALLRGPFQTDKSMRLTSLLVKALRSIGEHEEAVKIATEAATTHGTRHILEEALYFAGRFEEALAVSRQLFDEKQCPLSAYHAACSSARLERPDDAIAWLAKAAEVGFADLAHLERDTDLDRLRARPEFSSIVRRVAANAEQPKAETQLMDH